MFSLSLATALFRKYVTMRSICTFSCQQYMWIVMHIEMQADALLGDGG
jgi:hypothetical protein